ncbi:molybdopterin-dependent oxidoreductase [Desulforhabdus amnigena]|uniref:Molybdopterin oxidoreductase n=1 Tax=Desulforhabdus amnigena TaxID=40218 RepID=A0A9W6FWU6_9BACT|nr:molybdopterin-dependent oxidoreductase [Desulforhabdus amnigena]NLJ29851.1 molybdopterin-dependent oxidoreductase [Deltaproteobacteria bacterium]GLI36278.1 molybdopterin oxidoreductase [Desulforhabdus amnigena]
MREITACTLDCPDSCSLLILEDAEGKVQIKGNPDHPFTSGFTCRKARDFLRRLQSPDRLKTPLLRVDGGWKAIGWDDALDLCAEKIARYRREPASILHFHGEGAKGVLKQASKLFFALLGSTQVKGALCDAAGYVACVADFGSRDNNDINDLLHARRIVNWGKDLARSSVHTAAIVRKARREGCKVLTISPGGDGNGSFSDQMVRIRPGTDRFLAAAVIRLLWERNGVSSHILDHAHNGDAFKDLIWAQPPDRLMKWCDIDREGVERIYSFYASPEPTATLIGAGLQRYAYGGENVRFINALAMLSGNIGRSGGGTYFHLHSLRNMNLDWTKEPERKLRRSLLMPTIGRDILAATDPPVRMLWVDGSNVVNQAPDSHEMMRAFESIEFKVVVDAFMTDTAERADLVLPCALMMEQEDIEASYLHDYVHYVKPVFKAPGEAKSDYWILSELGRRLDPPVILPDPDECFRNSLCSPYIDISLEELRKRGYVRAKRPLIAYAGMRFDHPDGKYRFPTVLHAEASPPAGYPYRFLTLIRGDAIHSQILPDKQEMPPKVWVAPDHQALKHLDLEADIYLVSPLGRLKVAVEILEGLHPEVVVYRRGDWMKLGGGANQLIAAGLTDIGKGAPYYQQYVRLENG